jgi:Mn2+/Fe2+ NRAMP family transporter
MVQFGAPFDGHPLLDRRISPSWIAGSAAYAMGESRNWPVGFSRNLQEAKAFYAMIALATVIGMIVNFTSINPIQALYWSAVINGVIAVPVMVVMMLIASRADIMG